MSQTVTEDNIPNCKNSEIKTRDLTASLHRHSYCRTITGLEKNFLERSMFQIEIVHLLHTTTAKRARFRLADPHRGCQDIYGMPDEPYEGIVDETCWHWVLKRVTPHSNVGLLHKHRF